MATAAATSIAPSTRMGSVHLTVSDLSRSLDHWEWTVGLRRLSESDGRTSLGVDRELLVLVEEPGARPATGHTGLYHVALLLPDRPALARWLAHAARDRVPLQGLSDHFVSEAIYLADPDGHGIEIYADRPRSVWEGRVAEGLTTAPLDVDALLAELDADEAGEPFHGLPDGTTVGHVHFKVADVAEAIVFYHGVLGFELMAHLGPTAAFLGAGGYHHHVGANTWESRGAAPPPPGSAALRRATIVLPDADELDRVASRLAQAGRQPEEHEDGILVRDPSGNPLVLTT